MGTVSTFRGHELWPQTLSKPYGYGSLKAYVGLYRALTKATEGYIRVDRLVLS